ncbi:MAG: hypothetical protein V2I32_03170 [Desulforhopalus sp.]|jgi:hypothetical protein|nr:hypothetical protein [Desulforhopalus sp.]
MEFKDLWDLESAMQVLAHDQADSRLWAEAVEWLILNGPPEVRRLLLEASNTAIHAAFPDLKPHHYTPDGRPIYSVDDLAKALGISTSEARRILRDKTTGDDLDNLLAGESTGTVH